MAGRDATFARTLGAYRDLTTRALLAQVPTGGPRYLYDLVPSYPRRLGKGLRSALCLATCDAVGGSQRRALNTAVAIELFHNGFLILDDVQDGSLRRRGGPTLHREHGVGIALNVSNGTNLLALQRLMANRAVLGPWLTGRVMEETERMIRHSLEGQSMELAWIRDNACDLDETDYLQMCLKKTSWYSFIYPLRVGAMVGSGRDLEPERFCRFGWYFGAAFQIQDDILNLTGSYAKYGKELRGDLWEGKRTLMLVHLLGHCTAKERRRLKRFLATPREQRDGLEVAKVYRMMQHCGSIDFARKAARQLCGAALIEGQHAFREFPDSASKHFILDMVLYVASRDR